MKLSIEHENGCDRVKNAEMETSNAALKWDHLGRTRVGQRSRNLEQSDRKRWQKC